MRGGFDIKVVNLSKVFSLVSMVASNILSYHISEKSMPLP